MALEKTLNLLLINGNSNEKLTARLTTRALHILGPAVSVTALTSAESPPYIKTHQHCAIAAEAIARSIERELKMVPARPFDAVLIACFGEPGLSAARETAQIPVLGMAEASIVTAMQLGQRFSIITPGTAWPRMLQDMLHGMGVSRHCLGITSVDLDDLNLPEQNQEVFNRAGRAIQRQREELQPDVIIIGGAAFAGLAAQMPQTGDCLYLDSFDATVCQALGLMQLKRIGGPGAYFGL